MDSCSKNTEVSEVMKIRALCAECHADRYEVNSRVLQFLERG